MNLREAMAALEAAGTEQNRKTFRRHGLKEPMFGVSYAELGKFKKAIRVDDALAEGLWKSGNSDARILAAMISDPASATRERLESWAKDLDSYPLTDAFAKHAVAPSPLAKELLDPWTRSEVECIGSAGWTVLTLIAMEEHDLPEAFFVPWLERIEKEIPRAKNRVRYSMNNALIAIGLRGGALEKQAIAVAERIGVVEVDHGDTACKTPDAASYIAAGAARAAARRAKAAPKKPAASRPTRRS